MIKENKYAFSMFFIYEIIEIIRFIIEKINNIDQIHFTTILFMNFISILFLMLSIIFLPKKSGTITLIIFFVIGIIGKAIEVIGYYPIVKDFTYYSQFDQVSFIIIIFLAIFELVCWIICGVSIKNGFKIGLMKIIYLLCICSILYAVLYNAREIYILNTDFYTLSQVKIYTTDHVLSIINSIIFYISTFIIVKKNKLENITPLSITQ